MRNNAVASGYPSAANRRSPKHERLTFEPLFAQGTPSWYPQFSSAVNTAINGVAKGQMTVDQAMKSIADASQKAMSQ